MLKTEVFPHTQMGLDHYRTILSHVLFLTQNHRRGKWSGIDGNGIIRRKKRCTGLDSSGAMLVSILQRPWRKVLPYFFCTAS